MAELLHVVVATLRDDLDPAAAEELAALARALGEAGDVEASLVGRSEREIIAATWLSSRDALEAFASDPAHLRFVLEGVASATTGMWSASVAPTSGEPPPAGRTAALWAFGLPVEPPAFEWQVRELLDAIGALPGHAAVGPTMEERESFRAAGVVCIPAKACADFDAQLAAARPRWGAIAERIESARAPVVGA